jgi:hypothetical protein
LLKIHGLERYHWTDAMVRADAAIQAEPKKNTEGTDVSLGFRKRVRGWVWPGLRWNSA